MKLCIVHCCLLIFFVVVEKMRHSLSHVGMSHNSDDEHKKSLEKRKLSHDDKWLSEICQWLTLARNHPLKSFAQEIFQKITLKLSFSLEGRLSGRIPCANDIQAWLIFYTLIGLTLEVLSRDACVHQIYMLLLTWYWAPLWVFTLMYSPHFKSLIGTHKSSYLLFSFSCENRTT